MQLRKDLNSLGQQFNSLKNDSKSTSHIDGKQLLSSHLLDEESLDDLNFKLTPTQKSTEMLNSDKKQLFLENIKLLGDVI